jgi:hypothetical protein
MLSHEVTGDSVDRRADLFALGSILFEMLTRHRAFARGHTINLRLQLLAEPERTVSRGRNQVAHSTMKGIAEQLTDGGTEIATHLR